MASIYSATCDVCDKRTKYTVYEKVDGYIDFASRLLPLYGWTIAPKHYTCPLCKEEQNVSQG